MGKRNRNEMKNGSGAWDLTAYDAIKNVDNEDAECKKLIRTLLYIIDIAGFELEGRFKLVSKKTGREWR